MIKTRLEQEMSDQFGKLAENSYASHLPVIKWILANLKIKTVFEFGCGNYSTPAFVQSCESVESVEMQEQSWCDNISLKLKDYKNLTIKCMLGKDPAIEYFKNLKKRFDLVFVDGHGHSRWNAINEAFLKTDLIIVHDTQERGYKWENINIPAGWKKYDIRCFNDTWTTIYYNKKIVIPGVN